MPSEPSTTNPKQPSELSLELFLSRVGADDSIDPAIRATVAASADRGAISLLAGIRAAIEGSDED